MKRALGVVILLILCSMLAGWLFLGTKVPLNDRVWDLSFSKLNTIDFQEDGSLVIHNVRDFTYSPGAVEKREWHDTVVRVEDIERAYFFLDHFSPNRQVGHTFISFHLKDGNTVAFSIEARREATETYSFIGGFLNRYELQYLWGTERDLLTQRTVLKNEQLYRFPLAISAEHASVLFKGFATESNTLAATPRFYHTLSANCTNMLAKIVNKYHPGTLPYDIAWNLTGLSDYYLEDQGFIATNGRTREQMRAEHDLTAHRNEIATNTSLPSKEFEDFVKTLIAH